MVFQIKTFKSCTVKILFWWRTTDQTLHIKFLIYNLSKTFIKWLNGATKHATSMFLTVFLCVFHNLPLDPELIWQHLHQIIPLYFLENLLGHLHALLAVGLHHQIHQVKHVTLIQSLPWDAWETFPDVSVPQEPLELFELFLFQVFQCFQKPLSILCDCCLMNSKWMKWVSLVYITI